MAAAKKSNKDSLSDPKEMEIYECSDKQFEIIILKKIKVIQKKTDK